LHIGINTGEGLRVKSTQALAGLISPGYGISDLRTHGFGSEPREGASGNIRTNIGEILCLQENFD